MPSLHSELDTTCRLCLASGDQELTSIEPYIGTICGIAKFSLDSHLPQTMCPSCVVQVENAESLRRSIFKAESHWDRYKHVPGKVVLLRCHLCGFQCPRKHLHDHVVTQHGTEHLKNCLLCQVTAESSPSDAPQEPEAEEQKPEILITSVRENINDQQLMSSSFIDMNPRVKLERIDIDWPVDDLEKEYEEEEEELSEFVPSPQESDEEEASESSRATKRPRSEGEVEPPSKTPKAPAIFYCPCCPITRNYRITLRTHVMSYHSSEPVCLTCFQKFNSDKELDAHRKNCTMRANCAVCDEELANGKAYQKHLSSVHGKKSFRCTHEGCDQVFLHRYSWSRHTKIHTGQKGIKCPYEGCQARFHQSSNLVTHIRHRHTKEKTFGCKHCGEMFLMSITRSNHQNKCSKKTTLSNGVRVIYE